MIKDILFKKEVITKTNHMYRGIYTEFMKYERYRKARAMANMSIQKECFCCKESFEDDENLSLLFNGNRINVLCCEKCSNKLINKDEVSFEVIWEGPFNDAKDDAEAYCGNCNENINDNDWNYCPKCGVKLLIHGRDIP